jgi:sodium/hydrogen antiporter
VLFFLVLAEESDGAAGEAVELGGKVVVGAAIGVALAWIGGRSLSFLPGDALTGKYEGAYALGIGLAAFGLAEVTYGNGLIAAFVAGIALAVARHEIPETFSQFNESLSATFQVITFVVFGALVEGLGYHGSVPALALFVGFALLVARPAAVWVSLLGVELGAPLKAFIAWFGPKGVASMLFALFVLTSEVEHRELMFEIASFTVLASIVAHGLTDTVGAAWIERRLGLDDP